MRFLMAGVSAPSHIFPSLAVINELVGRGHDVTYVVGERHRALVEPTGATVVGTETIMPDADHPWPEDPGEAMQVFLDDAIATLPTIERLHPRTPSCTTSAASRVTSRRTSGASPPSSSHPRPSRGRASRTTWPSSTTR